MKQKLKNIYRFQMHEDKYSNVNINISVIFQKKKTFGATVSNCQNPEL